MVRTALTTPKVKEELLLLPESLHIRRMAVHAQRLNGIHGHELIPLVGFFGIQDRPSGQVQHVLHTSIVIDHYMSFNLTIRSHEMRMEEGTRLDTCKTRHVYKVLRSDG